MLSYLLISNYSVLKRILTGIQSSGIPHLGNILGAIKPALALANKPHYESFFFIADLHSLTTVKAGDSRYEATLATAAAWLACGLDPEKTIFYRQSHVSEVCELAWYLNCLTPYPMLANAHSFKDKKDKLADVNAGLFTYPVLMTADIILYDAHYVPVGKDQKQHLEITRDLAKTFNRLFGVTFVVPEAVFRQDFMVPGIDGAKMSKSYQNTIDLFSSDKALRKQVMRIKTDSLPLESPKDPTTCTIFKLYEMLATAQETKALRADYEGGNFGYGEAKSRLYKKLCDGFETERERYNFYMNHPESIIEILEAGEERARHTARQKLDLIRKALKYR